MPSSNSIARLSASRGFRDQILSCLADHVNQELDPANRPAAAESLLRETIASTGGSFENPDAETLLRAMRLIAARELKTGKSAKTIAENFHRIAKMITGEPGA
ncbi:MAG: hypothetical protein EPN93_18940 [Spirochaetes bacterium]|nr:MAG: hypothetical protein EPN93_18940 [Spirochaetota bacterium]